MSLLRYELYGQSQKIVLCACYIWRCSRHRACQSNIIWMYILASCSIPQKSVLQVYGAILTILEVIFLYKILLYEILLYVSHAAEDVNIMKGRMNWIKGVSTRIHHENTFTSIRITWWIWSFILGFLYFG